MCGGVERAGKGRLVGWAWTQAFLLDEKRTRNVLFGSVSEGGWHVKRNSLTGRNAVTPEDRSAWFGLHACLATCSCQAGFSVVVAFVWRGRSAGSGLSPSGCRPSGRPVHGFRDERAREAPDWVCVAQARSIRAIELAPGSARVTRAPVRG
jgi:hypothetical protein